MFLISDQEQQPWKNVQTHVYKIPLVLRSLQYSTNGVLAAMFLLTWIMKGLLLTRETKKAVLVINVLEKNNPCFLNFLSSQKNKILVSLAV